jgi:hypothetical protein
VSIRASNWAWETGRALGLNQGQLLVLVRVADHADNDGCCWPGTEGIADYTCMGESSVRRILGQLEKLGLLHRDRRKPKHGRGRGYDAITLHLDQALNLSGRAEATKRSSAGARSGPTNRSSEARPTAQSGVSPIERNHQGTVDTADQRSAVSRAKAQIPDYVSSLFPRLNRVGECKEAKRLNEAAVHRHCEKFADRDFELEVEKFADYWLTGAGQNRPMRDVAGAWRNWLGTAPPMGRRARILAEDRRRTRDHAATDAGKRALRDRIASAERKAKAA